MANLTTKLTQPTTGQITNAVNVNRNQSALVPFLHTEFHGVKASVYNKVPSRPHPLSRFGIFIEG
jgi:hypothetical protein